MKRLGIKMVVINKGLDPAVGKRCQKLKLEYRYDATKDKLSILKDVLAREQIKPESVLYIGDDMIDLPCLEYAGLAVTVADGAPECKKSADYITAKNGGQGAVRELCELIVGVKEGFR
jgi:YrbI family 3-deoxy-D-manno-octulosonate 8-phosphate phosphatase